MNGPARDSSLTLVLGALRHVLGAEPALDAGTDLFAVPGFDSLALAELVAELEDRIGGALDDALMTPDVFATPRTIARGLVAASSTEETP